MGVDGAHNTIEKKSAPTTLLGFYHAREVAGYCLAGAQGTVLGIAVDLSGLPSSLTSSSKSFGGVAPPSWMLSTRPSGVPAIKYSHEG